MDIFRQTHVYGSSDCWTRDSRTTRFSLFPLMPVAHSKNKSYFCNRRPIHGSPERGAGEEGCGEQTLRKKRLSALILDILKFSQNFCQSQGCSNGRCPWICNVLYSADVSEEILLDILVVYTKRGLLRCHLTLTGQCEKPQNVGWQQIQTLTLFRFNQQPTRGGPRHLNINKKMKKHFTIKLVLIALLAMISCTMKAETFECTTDDGFVYSFDTETQEVSLDKYRGEATEIVIPEFVTFAEEEYKVTSLGDWCFWGCSSLTSIVLPSSVTSLGDWCFYGCSSLTSIAIPSNGPSMGE